MAICKKLLSVLLIMAVLFSIAPISMTEASANMVTTNAPVFPDMPNDWSTEALQNAVDNGLLTGSNGRLLPKSYLTRAQMAAIVTRAFGATVEGDLSGFSDVKASDWFADEMAKAYQMGVIKGSNGKMNPNSSITRQEVFVILARALKLEPADKINLTFTDTNQIADWAKGEIYAVVNSGYLKGSNGKLNPRGLITRAEFAQFMYNILKSYISEPGEYTQDTRGNVMVNKPGVTLKNMTIIGDLIIGDGVGDGEVVLDGVVVTGRTVIRGGGENSIRVVGNSELQNIIIARVDGVVRVLAEDGTVLGEVTVDGSDDVIIEGFFGNITIVSPGITVRANNASIDSATIQGENSMVEVGEGSSIEDVTVNGAGSSISGAGSVGTVAANANDVAVTVQGADVTAGAGTTGVLMGEEVLEAGQSGIVGGSPRIELTGVTITGSVNVNSTLTAKTTPENATASYQWMISATQDGTYTNITGATEKTYKPASGDLGKFLKVTAKGTGGYSHSATSAATAEVKAALPPAEGGFPPPPPPPPTTPVTAVTIAGTAKVSSVLTANPTPATATVSYQWVSSDTADGTYVNISGATAKTYTLVAGDLGKFIKVKVTGTGSYTGSVTSSATVAVAPAAVSAVTIDGAAKVNSVLTANTTPADATVTYQWMSCDTAGGTYTDVSSAVYRTYTLGIGDVGKYFKVKATGTGIYGGSVISSATAAVQIIKVNSITVAGAGGATEVSKDGTLQMSATVEPSDAANKEYTWSVQNGTGTGTITAGGLLTGTGVGTVTVKATANDGSGVVGELNINITTPASYFGFDSAGGEITSYDIAGGTDVVIPSKIADVTVIKIGFAAFQEKGLTSVIIPDSVTVFDIAAFNNNSLTSISLPENTVRIDENAFRSNNIVSVSIPDSVTYIGLEAFSVAEDNITLGAGVSSYFVLMEGIPNLLKGHIGIPKSALIIPDKVGDVDVTSISAYAFSLCQITSVSIPAGVTNIGTGAFSSNSITSIQIGRAGVTIGDNLLEPDNNNFRTAYATYGAGTYTGTQTGSWTHQFKAVKDNAFNEFEQQLGYCTESDYTPENWILLNKIKTDGDAAIMNATGELSINGIKHQTVMDMLAVREADEFWTAYSSLTEPVYNKADIVEFGVSESATYRLPEIYSGNVTIEFDITALTSIADSSISFISNEVLPLFRNDHDAHYYTHHSIMLGITNNLFKAIDGNNFYSNSLETFSAVTLNEKYHIRLEASMSALPLPYYKVFITPASTGIEQQLGTVGGKTGGFLFRTRQLSPDDTPAYTLVPAATNVAAVAISGAYANDIKIENLVVMDETHGDITLSTIAIAGAAKVGSILTAATVPSSATVSYQWMSCDSAEGIYTDISGATSKTYTIEAAYLGKYIKVKATGTGSYTGTVTSSATAAVTEGVITLNNILGVTVPVTGAAPVSTLAGNNQYSLGITWLPADDTFVQDKVYTATITVTPKSGYTLTGIAANFFKVAGATTANALNSGVVTAVFPKTGLSVPASLYLGLPGGYDVTSKTIVDDFISKFPNITVTLDTSAWGTFTGSIQAKIAAKTAPDIWFQENAVILKYGKIGVAADLSGYITRDLTESDFVDSLFIARQGEKVWGVPHGANPIALAYNKTIFDSASEPYPTDNWTYDDMIDAAKRLNDDCYGFLTTCNITQGWFPWIKGAGGNCLDQTLTDADFLNPLTKVGIAKWANTFLVDQIAPDTSIGTTVLFGSGHGAMAFIQYSEVNGLNTAYPTLNYDTVMIPKATDGSGKRYVTNISNSWLINSNATQSSKDAAWEFIKHYLSAEGQDEVAMFGAALPIRKSSMAEISTSTKPFNKAAFTLGIEVGGTTMDETAAWNEWRIPANTVFMQIYEGTKSVDEGLAEIQTLVQQRLDANR